jgi:cytochrome c biogenesis protein CcdA/thiol-disulfide isomerase/thioredoxin
MALLVVVAFVAGLVTAVSPCVLPILPIVLAAGAGSDRRRPYLVIAGLIVSFAFFTLASVQIISALHLPSATLRDAAIAVVALFGLTLLVPALTNRFERLTAGLPSIGDRIARSGGLGAAGGIVTGIGLGLVWTPCAGPILGAITSLAVTAPGSGATLALVVAYAIGAGLPLLAIALGGRAAVARWRLQSASRWGGRVMGALVLAMAGLMALGVDTTLSNSLTSALPNWTGTLQTLERTGPVQSALHQLGVGTGSLDGNGDGASGLPEGPLAPEFATDQTWLNTPPLTMAGLRGKVVLVDFWTYSCINCIRTLPYVEGWYEKYRSDGFVVVGVHTPEFAFEHDTANVQAAIARFDVTYPVVQDNDYAIWTAYNNEYWPADYLIDATGHIRSEHFGEGDYARTEAEIASLLAEAGAQAVPSPVASSAPPPISGNQTPETYIGSDRARSFSSPGGMKAGYTATYVLPSSLNDYTFAVSGTWDFEPQYAVATAAGDELEMSFGARDVYLVLAADSPVQATVTVTGASGASPTEDVAADGSMTIGSARLYHLVHLPAAGRGIVTITFHSPGARAYAFTFGS